MHVRFRAVLVALVVFVALIASGGQAAAAPLLRLDGIGPLHLGMTRADAVETGWLAHRTTGCPLGGLPLPVLYRFTGPSAPSGIDGSAEFDRGVLRGLSFNGGVRTRVGVVAGQTTTADMVSRYRNAGFRAAARFESTFQGTFVTVRRRAHGRQVLGGFAVHGVVRTLGIPFVPVCE